MPKALMVAAAAALLLGACEQRQAVVAAASPQLPARNFMVFFPYDQSGLSADSQAVVREAAAAARARPDAKVTIAGHADTAGFGPYNRQLSERRATAVRDALIADGINPRTIVADAYGEDRLLVSTRDGMREPKNRRVEIIVQ